MDLKKIRVQTFIAAKRREAIAKFNEKPLLALTLRLRPNRHSAGHFYP
jgi:hypothetical protein